MCAEHPPARYKVFNLFILILNGGPGDPALGSPGTPLVFPWGPRGKNKNADLLRFSMFVKNNDFQHLEWGWASFDAKIGSSMLFRLRWRLFLCFLDGKNDCS